MSPTRWLPLLEGRVGVGVEQRSHRHADSSTVSKTSSEASNASASSWLHEPEQVVEPRADVSAVALAVRQARAPSE